MVDSINTNHGRLRRELWSKLLVTVKLVTLIILSSQICTDLSNRLFNSRKISPQTALWSKLPMPALKPPLTKVISLELLMCGGKHSRMMMELSNHQRRSFKSLPLKVLISPDPLPLPANQVSVPPGSMPVSSTLVTTTPPFMMVHGPSTPTERKRAVKFQALLIS